MDSAEPARQQITPCDASRRCYRGKVEARRRSYVVTRMTVARALFASLVLVGCAKASPSLATTAPDDFEIVSESVTGAGAISGVVTHKKSKERLPQAMVILQSTALPEVREASTNEQGIYAFGQLPPGTYSIQVLAGSSDTSKVTTLPSGARFRANFSVDPDRGNIVCHFPGGPRTEPDESLFSIGKQEARLLGVPPTKIMR